MFHLFTALLLILSGIAAPTDSPSIASERYAITSSQLATYSFTDNSAQEGTFSVGYNALFETQSDGTLHITFELLDTDKTGVVAFLWQQTPFMEFGMTDLGDNLFSISIDGLTSGQAVTYACKFAFAGGLAVTDYITYVVGDNCEVDPEKDASLSDLKVDGLTIEGFPPTELFYEFETTSASVPTVTVTTSQASATAEVNPASSVPGTTTVLVTAEDGTTTQTYSVEFLEPVNYVLVWNDEFDEDGAVNDENWYHQTYPIINGVDWANNEEQHYTNRIDNSIVEGGILKIIALKEPGYQQNGVSKDYTSGRLNSKFAFTYGRVDIRAQLPEQLGTWPALWMLGKNISEAGAYWETQGFGTTPWPATGEIDIMEQFGRTSDEKNDIHGSTHTPRSFGSTENTAKTTIGTSTTAFHVYSIIWDENEIQFLVDDTEYYTYNPTEKYGGKNTNPASNEMNWPFDEPQYIILNVAMGGVLGGTIPDNFTQAVMDVDYVRVYQKAEAFSVADASWTLDENSANGTLVGTISTDYTGDGRISYSITAGNEDGVFEVNASTGEVTVADASLLDFATKPTYVLTVAVTDGITTESATITITLNESVFLTLEEAAEGLFKAFPNPVDTRLTLTFAAARPFRLHQVADIAGRVLTLPTVSRSNAYELDFSEASNGIYVVVLTDGKNYYSLRVLKI